MAAQTNGHAVEPGKGRPNGNLSSQQVKVRAQKRGLMSRGLSIIARLFLWYSIVTVLFRCPASPADLNDTSPAICQPYFDAKVQIIPYVTPYYQSYAAPYVDSVRPYVTPIVQISQRSYATYGAPNLRAARKFGEKEWQRVVRPQLYSATDKAREKYEAVLAPHVDKAIQVAAPYYNRITRNAAQVYNTRVIPVYAASLPVAQKGLEYSGHFAADVAAPYIQQGWETAVVLCQRTLWPRIRILYGENVEPQLIRIRERLGRYREGRKLKAVVNDIDRSTQSSSSSLDAPLSTLSSTSVTSSDAKTTSSSSVVSTVSPEVESSPEEQAAQLRQKIANDLKTWQEKFARAADKGAEDLAERVNHISARQIETQVEGVGEALIIELEQASATELVKLKEYTISLVRDLPADATETDMDNAKTEFVSAVRASALVIKSKAQALRTWKHDYDAETKSLINQATESTLDILDSIRDLGLQEIGMRWAWMDGVTYKDWSEYHALKKTFDEWRAEIQSVAAAQGGSAKALEAADDLEARGMIIAEESAKELGELKNSGQWKIEALDSSDNFDLRYLPPKIVHAGQKVMSKLQDITHGSSETSQGVLESIISQAGSQGSDGAESVNAALSTASEAILGTAAPTSEDHDGHVTETRDTTVSYATEKAEQAFSVISEHVVGSDHVDAEFVPNSFLSKASSTIEETILETVRPDLDIDQIVGEDGTTMPSEKADTIVPTVQSIIVESTSPDYVAEEYEDRDNEDSIPSGDEHEVPEHEASATQTDTSQKVWGGAMAQAVNSQRFIIYDDHVDGSEAYSEKLQSFISEAGDRYAEITKAVSDALLQPTSTRNPLESITSLAGGQYESALSIASNVLYGPTTGTVESISSVASDRYARAVSAASAFIYGTTPAVTQVIATEATSQYSLAVSHARHHYSQAQSIISAQISGKPLPIHEQILSSFDSVYSASLTAASSVLASAVSAASTGIYGTPPGPQESLVSIAREKYSQAMDSVSSQYEQAKLAISGSPTPIYESLLSAAQVTFTQMSSAANAQFALATSAASKAYYGPPPGSFESISSVASAKLAEGLSAASAQYASARSAVLPEPTPAHQQYIAEAQRQYYQGIGIAHQRYSDFLDVASKAVYGTATPVYESLYSVVSGSIYPTADPAYKKALSIAHDRYSSAASVASENMQQVLASASSALGHTSQSLPESVLSVASAHYDDAISSASSALSVASESASSAIYGRSTGSVESIASAISASADSVISVASENIVGSETPWTESVASQASANWQELVSKASEQIYGSPTPFYESVWSQAGDYAAQATDAAAVQYDAVSAIISELVVGREPDFTESVMSRFSSAYHTGAPAIASSASSYASEAYASASSVVSSVFTPPPTLEAILESANEQVNLVVDAASAQIYGTSKVHFEQASSAASHVYEHAHSKASEAVYGTPTGYAEAAQASLADVAASAQSAISVAFYGTPTGAVEHAATAAGDTYSSISSVVDDKLSSVSGAMDKPYATVSSMVSPALYGPEQGALESAQSRLSVAIESARSKLTEFAATAGGNAQEAVKSLSDSGEQFASSVASVVSSATSKAYAKKDEL